MSTTLLPSTRPACNLVVPLSERSDEELLLEYRERGNTRAFEQLVGRYERELYNYLRRYLGSAEMAEDTFQQTFLQVHLKCDQFEVGRKVRPWLYTVATHQAIDAQRRNRRHRSVSLDRRGGSGVDEEKGALLDLLVQDEPGPAESLQTEEARNQMRRAVAALPESLRRVVLLIYYQGMKYREAAEVLDLPVGTVKSRLHAAIRKMNELLNCVTLPK